MSGSDALWPRNAMIAAVDRSPAAVLAQDKVAWLALFSETAVVEDPVGTMEVHKDAWRTPRRGSELGRFFDTFIAGNEVRFEVLESFVAAAEVARDVVVHTRLSTGLRVEVPAHLVYHLVEADGRLLIQHLRAVWDLRRSTARTLAAGLLGLYSMSVVSVRMLRNHGVRGMTRYGLGAAVGILGRGREAVARLARAIGDRDGLAIDAIFARDSTTELPVGVEITPRELFDRLDGGMEAAEVVTAGFTASFRFASARAGGPRGLAFLEFDPVSKRVRTARFFCAP